MEKEEEQAQASQEALSSACWPGGTYGTHSVLVEPAVGSEPEKGSPALLTLQVKHPFVGGVNVGFERFLFSRMIVASWELAVGRSWHFLHCSPFG